MRTNIHTIAFDPSAPANRQWLIIRTATGSSNVVASTGTSAEANRIISGLDLVLS